MEIIELIITSVIAGLVISSVSTYLYYLDLRAKSENKKLNKKSKDTLKGFMACMIGFTITFPIALCFFY